MKRIILISAIILSMLFFAGLGVTIGAQFFFNQHQDIFFSGVMIEGYNLGGLNEEEVLEFLNELTEPVKNQNIVLEINDQEWEISPEEIGLAFEKEQIVNEAFAIGRQGNIWKRSFEIWKIAGQGLNLGVDLKYDQQSLENKLIEITDEINTKAQDAYLDLETGKIVDSQIGLKLDVQSSKAKIISRLQDLETLPIRLVLSEEEPRVNSKEIRELGLTEELSTYLTRFDQSEENRNENIRLASNKINGIFLEPGESFSFNEIVGPRTRQRGFREALEIVNQEFVTGIGGGICQVASTLYNSVLLADLEVLTRVNHSRPVSYVDLGRGAAIYYGLLDFEFKNSSSEPIMILTKMLDGELRVSLMGKASNNYEVQILTSEPEILAYQQLERVDPNLTGNQEQVIREGRYGYRVRVTRRVLDSDELIREELISEETYLPLDKVIKVSAN